MSTATLTLLALGAIVLVILVLAAWRLGQRRSLRERFGPEYDHAVAITGDPRRAEKELREREAHLQGVTLRELDAAEKSELANRWRAIQVDFVDRPKQAVEAADRLVTETMRRLGYPDGDFRQRLADASVKHPLQANDYREGRRLAELSRHGGASTEDLRQCMVHYRNLFEALLGVEAVPLAETDGSRVAAREVRKT